MNIWPDGVVMGQRKPARCRPGGTEPGQGRIASTGPAGINCTPKPGEHTARAACRQPIEPVSEVGGVCSWQKTNRRRRDQQPKRQGEDRNGKSTRGKIQSFPGLPTNRKERSSKGPESQQFAAGAQAGVWLRGGRLRQSSEAARWPWKGQGVASTLAGVGSLGATQTGRHHPKPVRPAGPPSWACRPLL